MSKAIAGAAMLAGGLALMFIPGLNVLFTPWLLNTMIGLLATGVSMEAGAIADALTSNRGQNITTRMAAGLRQIVYGMQRVGGTVIYQSTTGAGGSGGNYLYNYIIVLATHPIDAVVNLYLDGRQVFWSNGSPGGNVGCGALSTPPATTVTISGGAVTAITATGGAGLCSVPPVNGYRVRIYGGGGSGATAIAHNTGTQASPTWTVTVLTGGSGYATAPRAEIQGAWNFGGAAAADQQDPTQPGYGLGYGIGPNGQHYDFAGKVYCEARFGDQLPGDVMASLSENDGNWSIGGALGAEQAKGTANINPMAGTVVSVSMQNGGMGYDVSSPPNVTFSGGGGSGATGHAIVSGNSVLAVVVDAPGSGYTSAPLLTIAVPSITGAGGPYVGGCAYIYLNVGYDAVNFPSAPEIRVTLTGKNDIYDPRTGDTGYSTNWALQVADVISDPNFGLGDGPIAAWPAAAVEQLIAAANVCDEQIETSQGPESNYAQHIHYDTSVAPGDALQLMMTSAGGRLSRIGGGWYIFPAYWQGPSFSFDESLLIDAISWTPNRSFKDLINRVNGTYIAPNYPYNCVGNLYDKNGWFYGTINDVWPFAWQSTNFPQYAQDTLHGYAADQWLVADGGTVLPRELGLHGVISIVQAQRVAKILLLRNRQQGSGTFSCHLAAWQMQPIDVMQFSFAAMGWGAKYLEVDSLRFSCEEEKGGGGDGARAMALSVSLNVVETDPSVYEWSPDEELTPYDVAAAPGQIPYTPAPPTSMTVTSSAATALVGADGIAHPRALIAWDAPEDNTVTQIELQYQLQGAGAWQQIGYVSAGLFQAFSPTLVGAQVYNFQIRSVRASGSTSGWVAVDGLAASLTLSLVTTSGQTVATAGTVQAVAESGGRADIIVEPFTAISGNVSVICLPGGAYTISGLNQAQFYWVYYIDPNFQGGAITPIATQNSADFLNKLGYFLIGSITTPTSAASGPYLPTSYATSGNLTVTSPANAYDGNPSDYATLPGYGPGAYSSICVWSGFPAVVTTRTTTLSVSAAVVGASGLGALGQVSVSLNNGATWSTLLNSSADVATSPYLLAVPSGADLSDVLISASAAGSGSLTGAVTLQVSGISIQ